MTDTTRHPADSSRPMIAIFAPLAVARYRHSAGRA